MDRTDKFLCFLIIPALVTGQLIQVTGLGFLIALRYIYLILILTRLTISSLPNFKLNRISIIFTAIICIGLLRTNGTLFTLENNILETVFYLVTYLFFLRISKYYNSINYVFLGLFSILILNILLLVLGIHNETIYKVSSESSAVILSKLIPGINFTRLLYPISNGVNNYGIQLGVITLFFLLNLKNRYYIIYGVITGVGLLFCDTRSAIIIIIILIIIKLFIQTKSLFKKTVYVFLFVAIPIVAATFSRNEANSSDLKTLNSRLLIWNYSSARIGTLELTETLFGMGRFSSVPLGVSVSIDDDYVSDGEYVSYHNTFLQFYFDWGLLGLCFMIFLIIWAIINSKTKSGLIYIVIYFLLVGFTESALSYHYTSLLILFLFIVTFIENQKRKINFGNI